uniref:Pentatricopeptide repeat-containing protein n=1 Tax=Oryza punctata TaxID=4537 RepID=A0A0E0JF77_ORYPU
MRNLLGVPNTLNVLTAYPLLLAGVPGLVLCLCGSGCFGISLRWEALGWFLFYAGNVAAAFGSAYYHLKPDDDRLIWDRLPMMISASSMLSILVIERVDERAGLSCLLLLLSLILVSSACERVLDDMRLWVVLNSAPCIAIPAMLFLFPPKYTHSRFWFLATGFYLLARFEGLADRKVYSVNRYFISGHSLEHLCFAMVTLILTVMLSFRNVKIVSGTHSQMRRLLRARGSTSRPSHRPRRARHLSTAAGDHPIHHHPPTTSAAPWNRLLRAHLGRSRGDLALALYRRMRALSPSLPNSYTLPLALRAAASPRVASAVHAHALHLGLHAQHDVAGQILAAYSRLGRAADARHVFDAMPPGRTTFNWNALISAYSNGCDPDAAWDAFTRMAAAGARPDAVTWTALLSAHARCVKHADVLALFGDMHRSGCEGNAESMAVALSACPYAGDLALAKGKAIHGCGVVKGVIHGYLFVTNSLVCMYGKLGEMDDAKKVFRDATEKNTVTWNTLITSYAAAGLCNEALDVLAQMEQIGGTVAPNVVSWSAIIGGLASSGDTDRALELFRRMQQRWLSPNVVTMATILSACADLLALRLGRELHGHAMKAKLDRHSLVENALINMYAKCGKVAGARKVFDGMKTRDLISWNSMLTGYGTHGLCDEALALFTDMAGVTVEPDGVTFVAVLSACSHAGRVPEGRRLFDHMVREHKISPSMEHYTCMVDLLGRAGLLRDASELIETMPMRPDLCVWGALLNSCRIHGDAAMAEATIANVLQSEAQSTGNHILITNLYAMCGMWDESKKVRVMTKEAGLRKNPGQSWIETNNKVVAFAAGSAPPNLAGAEDVFRVLDELYAEMEDEQQCTMDDITSLVAFYCL